MHKSNGCEMTRQWVANGTFKHTVCHCVYALPFPLYNELWSPRRRRRRVQSTCWNVNREKDERMLLPALLLLHLHHSHFRLVTCQELLTGLLLRTSTTPPPSSHTLLHKHSNSFEWNERKRFDGRLNLKKLISAHHAGTGPRNLHQQLVVVVPWNGCVSRRHPPMIDDVPIRRGAQKHIYTEAVRFV